MSRSHDDESLCVEAAMKKYLYKFEKHKKIYVISIKTYVIYIRKNWSEISRGVVCSTFLHLRGSPLH